MQRDCSVSRLHHTLGSRPAKAGWPWNHLVISCLRLPGPTCHTSTGACGSNRRNSVLY